MLRNLIITTGLIAAAGIVKPEPAFAYANCYTAGVACFAYPSPQNMIFPYDPSYGCEQSGACGGYGCRYYYFECINTNTMQLYFNGYCSTNEACSCGSWETCA